MHKNLNDDVSLQDRLGRASAEMAGLVEDGELWRLADRDVIDAVDAAYALVAQAQAAALTMLGELDSRALAVQAGATSTQAWLAGRRRLGPTDAKCDVTLAQLLHRATRRLVEAGTSRLDADVDDIEGAALRDALAAGDVSLGQAQAIATALDELPDDTSAQGRVAAERLLLAEADQHGPAALMRLGQRIGERLDPDTADARIGALLEREERQAQRLRSGTRFADGHGSVWYRFKVPVGDDAFIGPVLDTLAAPQPTRQPTTQPAEPAVDEVVDGFDARVHSSGWPTRSWWRSAESVWTATCRPRAATGHGC